MRLFGQVNSAIDKYDRAEWQMPPFDMSFEAVGGPYTAEAAQVFVPGAEAAAVFVSGAEAAAVFVSGAEAAQVYGE